MRHVARWRPGHMQWGQRGPACRVRPRQPGGMPGYARKMLMAVHAIFDSRSLFFVLIALTEGENYAGTTSLAGALYLLYHENNHSELILYSCKARAVLHATLDFFAMPMFAVFFAMPMFICWQNGAA